MSHHSYQHHKNISPYGAFSPLQDIIFSADNRSVSMRSVRACGRARGEFPCAHVQRGHRASVLARAVGDDGAASRTSPFFCTLSGGAYIRRGSARGPPPHNTDAAKNTKPATYAKHTLDVVKPRDEEQYDSVQIKAIYTTAKGG